MSRASMQRSCSSTSVSAQPRRAIAWVVCAVLGLSGWMAWPSRADACTCFKPPARERKRPDVVFVGRLIATKEVWEPSLAERDPQLLEADWSDAARKQIETRWLSGLRHRFRVALPLRGVRGRRELVIETSSSTCGFRAELGARYRMRAWREAAGRLATSLCARNRAVWPTDKMHERRRERERNRLRRAEFLATAHCDRSTRRSATTAR